MRSSSSAQCQAFIPAAIPPWEHIPNTLSSPVLALAVELTLKILLCVARPMPRWNMAPRVTSKQSSEKPKSAREKAKHTNRDKQNISAHPAQLEWSVESREAGRCLGKSHTEDGQPSHWFLLPLSGEAHAKTRQFPNKATEMQICQARTSCFKPGG